MQQPLGFTDPKSSYLVCKLNKALYGLKQAPRARFEKLQDSLVIFGFSFAKSDLSLFVKALKEHTLFILVYMDDILITGSSQAEITAMISKMHSSFALKDLGEINYFFGIQVHHAKDDFHLSQTKYITNLLCKAKMQYANGLKTPMIGGESCSTLGVI